MITGFNSTNWFDAYKPSDIASLNDMGEFLMRFRWDKNPDKILDLINMNNSLNNKVKIIFTGNIDTNVGDNIAAIRQILDSGIEIIAVEADNEYYAKQYANFNFDTYKSKFLPLKDAVKANFPGMPITVFMAPNIGMTSHKKFNNALKTYMETAPQEDGVSVHIYFGNEIPGFSNFPKPRIVTDNIDLELDSYFNNLYESAKNSTLFKDVYDYTVLNFPGRKIYVTEFGFSNTGELNNTLSYNMAMWKEWNKNKFDVFCQHNGISPTDTGFITPSKGSDLAPRGENVKRLPYWTYKLFKEMPTITNEYENIQYNISDQGKSYFWYINNTDNIVIPLISIDTSLKVLSTKCRYIKGNHSYSSSGDCPFMANGSVKSYEIDGIKENDSVIFPPKSFGYIVVETGLMLEINEPPVAKAGSDKTFTIPSNENNIEVLLDGSLSTDKEGKISYKWYNSNDSILSTEPRFNIILTPGDYIFYLDVEDSGKVIDTDSIAITVIKEKPKKKPWYCTWFGIGCK